MHILEIELHKFWKWSNVSREEYADTSDFGNWEIEYPDWIKIYDAALIEIDELNSIEIKKDTMYSLILEAIAIDNEKEVIVKACENKLIHLDDLFDVAITNIFPEARRQVAELIGRKVGVRGLKSLLSMVYDENKYVQRSALISLSKIDKNETEKIALDKLRECDEYIRLFSLRVLREISPSILCRVVEMLKYDDSIFIQEEIKEIAIEISN